MKNIFRYLPSLILLVTGIYHLVIGLDVMTNIKRLEVRLWGQPVYGPDVWNAVIQDIDVVRSGLHYLLWFGLSEIFLAVSLGLWAAMTLKKTEPNQSLETTTLAVTPAALHPSRQPGSRLI